MRKYNIFIDTTEFISSNFNIESILFSTIKDFCISGKTKLIVCDITIQEIYSNLNKAITDADSAIRKAKKDARVLRNVQTSDYEFLFNDFDKNKIFEKLRQKIDSYFEICNAEIIEATKISPIKIFNAYFKSEAPFSTGKKKSEFPDAFVISALSEWCIASGENIFVVSNDSDFKNTLTNHENLEHLNSIGKYIEAVLSDETSLIDYLRQCLDKSKSKLFSFMVDEIKQYEVMVEDADPDAEGYIENATISELNDLAIIDVTDTSAIIEANVSADLDVHINCYDPDSWFKDPDDKSIHYWDKIENTFQREEDFDIQIKIEFEKDTIQNFDVREVIVNKGELLSFYLNEYDGLY